MNGTNGNMSTYFTAHIKSVIGFPIKINVSMTRTTDNSLDIQTFLSRGSKFQLYNYKMTRKSCLFQRHAKGVSFGGNRGKSYC